MFLKCCVRNCANTRQDATLHKFPTNEKRLNKWIKCLKDDSLIGSSLKNLFVCQKHFEKRFIGANSRLLSYACPTLFSPNEISSGIPDSDDTENLAPNDHTYSRKRHFDHTYSKEALSVPGANKGIAEPSLQADTRRDQLLQNQNPDNTITIGGSKLNIIYDPSHLIKGIRNNFLSKDIVYEGKISRWQDIVDVYNTDANHTETRLLHKLNDEHVIPEKIKKMKVKNCVRVLSKTVAAALSYTAQFSNYIDGTPVSSTIKNTAETVSFFDDLFDSP